MEVCPESLEAMLDTFRNIIIPLPRYHTRHLARARAPLQLSHTFFLHDKYLQTPPPVRSFSY